MPKLSAQTVEYQNRQFNPHSYRTAIESKRFPYTENDPDEGKAKRESVAEILEILQSVDEDERAQAIVRLRHWLCSSHQLLRGSQ